MLLPGVFIYKLIYAITSKCDLKRSARNIYFKKGHGRKKFKKNCTMITKRLGKLGVSH